jgi:riboflavin synthase
MFTGLVERIGTVRRVSRGAGLVLEIGFEPWPERLTSGESVAVNGVCLTVAQCDATRFTADVLRETEMRTGLKGLVPGEKVNLERALRAGQPLGGHLVQGHVDSEGVILSRTPRGRDFRLTIRCGRVLAAQSVVKGSVAIDGVSLTISDLGEDWLTVDVIPTTARETTLGAKRVGAHVNLEGDVVGKYVAKASAARGTLSEEMLRDAGFIP